MISGKSQIVRQRKIDNDKIVEQTVNDDFSLDVSEELEQINQSIAKLTLKLNSESDDYTGYGEFDFSNNYQYDLEPSSSSSASSPSNLLSGEKSSKSSLSKSPIPPMPLDSEPQYAGKSHKFIKSSTLNSQPTKTLVSTNSVPLTHCIKSNRLANFMRLGQANSFFSRSCPGEEAPENMPTEPRQSHKSESNNRIRNFLTFSSRLKSRKSETSPNASTRASASSVFSETSSTNNEKPNEKRGKIGSYEVDLEKLARELVLPSVEAPLTSFKPPLQSSKTIDLEIKINPKKQLQRSMTQNK